VKKYQNGYIEKWSTRVQPIIVLAEVFICLKKQILHLY